MGDIKTTSSSNLTKPSMEKAKADTNSEKNKMTAHDRPAVFIEDVKYSKYYNHKNSG